MYQCLKTTIKIGHPIINLVILYLLSFTSLEAQILTNWPCHAMSENTDPNYYFTYDPATNGWTEIGDSDGTIYIEAIAYNPILNILYATDEDDFGTIDQTTGVFTIISDVGSGNGSLGNYNFDDIDGLSYDPVRDVIWATERRGSGSDLDLLFQINPTTGLVVPDVFGPGIDYVEVAAVTDPVSGNVYHDIDDIAYNSYTGILYAIQNQGGTGGALTILDYNNMGTPSVVGSFPVDDMEGLGISYFGYLYGSTGNNGPDPEDSNRFFYIDHTDGSILELNAIDETGTRVDFESFDCFSAYNDLSLKKILSPLQATPIIQGSLVTFDITVTNQGNIPNSNIAITDYIPEGLTLADTSWVLSATGTMATHIISGPLDPNESITVSISFTVNPDATGQITNIAEVSHSEYPDISPPIILPDIDSNNDTIPDNDNLIDDQTTGGGPHLNEDEDDHDIASITIEDCIKKCLGVEVNKN